MGKVFQALNKSKTSIEEPFVSGEKEQSASSAVEDIRISGSDNCVSGKDSDAVGSQKQKTSSASMGDLTPNEWDPLLVSYLDPSSGVAENIRRLRSKIFHTKSGTPYKKILVTSSGAGAGKSFVCANLGVSIAQGLDEHALMIDCDLRRSKLGSMFKVPNKRGLVDHLQSGEELSGLITKSGMRKLSIIPAGPKPINPAELLGSEKVIKMLDELKNRYDDRFILLDTAPFEYASETAVLAKHVDGVIVVVRWGGESREKIKKMVDALGRDKIIGIVFNAYQTNLFSSKITGYEDYGYSVGDYGQDRY